MQGDANPVNKVVDKKRIIKKGGPRRRRGEAQGVAEKKMAVCR
jgi:hypothetical protein